MDVLIGEAFASPAQSAFQVRELSGCSRIFFLLAVDQQIAENNDIIRCRMGRSQLVVHPAYQDLAGVIGHFGQDAQML